MKKSGFWMILIGIILLAGMAAAILCYGGEEKHTAEITLDGKLLRIVDLHRDQTFIVESEWGKNTVVVENGTIRVESASCPDHVCVNRGACSGGVPIVCLPNRLVIAFADSVQADAVSG